MSSVSETSDKAESTTKNKTTKKSNTTGTTSKIQFLTTEKYVPQKKTTTPTTTQKVSTSGTFTFTVYGFGHGVGMSQWGAIYYARAGATYTQILNHYYPGVTLVRGASLPKKIKYGGVEYSPQEYLYRSTQAEIGSTGFPIEAIKANVVATYTIAKKFNFNVSKSVHYFSSSMSAVSPHVKAAVDAVLGEYMTYNGSPINAVYFSMSAGQTVSSKSVWGVYYPYLTGGVESFVDLQNSGCRTTYTVSSEELKRLIKRTTGINLTGDPATWLQILGHDGTVDDNMGYVDKIRVGNKTYSGTYFRESVMDFSIRSHCFNFTYTPD